MVMVGREKRRKKEEEGRKRGGSRVMRGEVGEWKKNGSGWGGVQIEEGGLAEEGEEERGEEGEDGGVGQMEGRGMG